uniref:Uncharacterized protein n=1 Tax=Steinernema glaseri TaxID=37863 RepID=A0A1I7ZZ82_9BILA
MVYKLKGLMRAREDLQNFKSFTQVGYRSTRNSPICPELLATNVSHPLVLFLRRAQVPGWVETQNTLWKRKVGNKQVPARKHDQSSPKSASSEPRDLQMAFPEGKINFSSQKHCTLILEKCVAQERCGIASGRSSAVVSEMGNDDCYDAKLERKIT